jgi:HK97 family phage prohead protease
MTDQITTRPPRDSLYRELHVPSVVEFRDVTEADDLGDEYIGLLCTEFLVFNQWTEINSIFEGNFMERFAAGSTRKTLRESRSTIRPLFQHGRDPQVGDKPLGPIRLLEERDTGAYAEVPLLDTSYNRDLLPGLKNDLYGASHRFRVMREDIRDDPGASEHNPKGLPERTIKEAQIMEFGPVTFPAYQGATAGVRSITDQILFGDFARDPEKLRALVDAYARSLAEGEAELHAQTVKTTTEDEAPPEDRAGLTAHPDLGRRDSRPLYGTQRKDKPSWHL